MLYQLHELQKALFLPMLNFSDVGSSLFSNPLSPFAYSPLSRSFAASYEVVNRFGKSYSKPAWGLDTAVVDGQSVAVQNKISTQSPFCHLVHFERDLPLNRPKDPCILLVAPLSGHHATLLRDTVHTLLPQHDVYVTDWVDARTIPLSDGPFHLDDYVHTIQGFIRHLGPNIHVVSVCQPTVPVLAAISLMASAKDPALPKSMVMMGGPIDTRESPTQVNRLAENKPFEWFEEKLIHMVPGNHAGAGRHVYPGFLQHAGFIAMNPDRHLKSHYDFYLDLLKGDDNDAEAHRRFYNEYNAVLDMPAEFYLDTIEVVFQNHDLPKGTWVIDGKTVKPSDISNVALFTIEGELDDISGEGQTQAAQSLCSGIPKNLKQHFTAPQCGHYGIFAGRRWREDIYPKIAAFIRRV